MALVGQGLVLDFSKGWTMEQIKYNDQIIEFELTYSRRKNLEIGLRIDVVRVKHHWECLKVKFMSLFCQSGMDFGKT